MMKPTMRASAAWMLGIAANWLDASSMMPLPWWSEADAASVSVKPNSGNIRGVEDQAARLRHDALDVRLDQRVERLLEVDDVQPVRERPRDVPIGDPACDLVRDAEARPDCELEKEISRALRQDPLRPLPHGVG